MESRSVYGSALSFGAILLTNFSFGERGIY